MRTARIGSLEVSVIGLGCNNFGRQLDEERSAAVVHAALDGGITFFDTSDNYGDGRSEGFLARALGSRRDEVVIATKFAERDGTQPDGSGGARPAYIRQQIERSLRELNTDYIDLYQQHHADPLTPIEDSLGTMVELVQEGKVLEIGCSNFTAEQMREAAAIDSPVTFLTNQIEYSIANRAVEHDGVAEAAEELGVGLIPYRPLAKGLMSGTIERGKDVPETSQLARDRFSVYLVEENYEVVERLKAFAQERGISPVQIALTWLLARPTVSTVIPGASRPEQVYANAATGSIELSTHDLNELNALVDEVVGDLAGFYP